MGRPVGSKNKGEVPKENVVMAKTAITPALDTAEAIPPADNASVQIGKIRIQPSPEAAVIVEEVVEDEDPIIYDGGEADNISKESELDGKADKGEEVTTSAAEEKPIKTETDDDIEDARFKGKDKKAVYESYVNLEKLLGAQAGEIGTYRKLFDNLVQTPEVEKSPVETEIDFISDPNKAMDILESRVVGRLDIHNTYLEKQRKLDAKHPDRTAIIKTPEFDAWVKTMPPVIMAQNTNPEVADYILTEYKRTMAAEKAHKETLNNIAIKQTGAAAMGTVSTGGKNIPVGKSILSRAGLAKLLMENPAEYRARQSEIMAAYAEGRVK